MSDKSYRTGACGNHCEACARRDDRIEQLQADLELREAEIERLRTALVFYADGENYNGEFKFKECGCPANPFDIAVLIDDGVIAREALKEESQ